MEVITKQDWDATSNYLNVILNNLAKTKKKIVYIDMDGVIADFDKAINQFPSHLPGFFETLELVEGAEKAVRFLAARFDVYILSTPQWSNPNSWMEKRLWIENYFGDLLHKRLILSHNKGLLKGDYLIDDRVANGVENFEGEHIHFGSEKFPNWESVLNYFKLL